MARPLGLLHPGRGQMALTNNFAVSITAICPGSLSIFTKIWPWYAVWPLAFGALKPMNSPTRLAVLLSAGMATLYGFLDYCNTEFDWLYAYRSIPTIVLPVVLFALLKCVDVVRREPVPLPSE